MNNHDILRSVLEEKNNLSKISTKAAEISDLDGIIAKAEDPKVIALLMVRAIREREHTNSLMETINEKYDRIMLALKSPEAQQFGQIGQNRFEVLAEQDQKIIKAIEQKGGCTATDITKLLGYKGLNAACQRLNKLFREGHLTKVQSGRKVLYLAKS